MPHLIIAVFGESKSRQQHDYILIMPHLIIAVFGELLDIAKKDLYFGHDRRPAGRSQNQVDEIVRWLVLLCHQAVLEPPVALSHVKGRHGIVRCMCKLGSQRDPDLRCGRLLIIAAFRSVLVEFDQRPFKPLDRSKGDRKCFGSYEDDFECPSWIFAPEKRSANAVRKNPADALALRNRSLVKTSRSNSPHISYG